MKRATVFALMGFVFLTSSFLVTESFAISRNFAAPENIRTCGGEFPVLGAQNYFYGFKWGEGGCGTMSFYANSPGEAFDCAKRYCKNCELEDLTSLYQFGTIEGFDIKTDYCPAKK